MPQAARQGGLLRRERLLDRMKTLAAVRLFQGGQAYDYAAIVFAYLAGTQAHQYWKTRRKSALVTAVAYTLVLAANLVLFLG